MDSVRIDKWLWAARFFKTRALASKACDIGRILSNGVRAKPARDVRVGDLCKLKMKAACFRSRFSNSAKCADPPPWRKRSIAKPIPAAKPASSSQKSAKPCSNTPHCPSAGLPSAIGGALFSFEVGGSRRPASASLQFRKSTPAVSGPFLQSLPAAHSRQSDRPPCRP